MTDDPIIVGDPGPELVLALLSPGEYILSHKAAETMFGGKFPRKFLEDDDE